MSETFRTIEPLDEGMVTGGIEVIAFLDSDGDECYRIRIGDGMTLTTTLGLLRIAEQEALNASDWEPGDAA